MEWWSNGVMYLPNTPVLLYSNTPFHVRCQAVATPGRNGLEVGVTGGSFYG